MLKGEEDVTETGWTGKEQAIQEDLICEMGRRAEYKTEPDSINQKDLTRLFTEYIYRNVTLTKTEETSFGLNKPKMTHRKNFRDSYSKSKKNATSTQPQPKNY